MHGMNRRNDRKAVQFLAPEHRNHRPQCVTEPHLHIAPGLSSCKSRFKDFSGSPEKLVKTPTPALKLKFKDAMRIKSAEFRIKLGQLDEAILELKSLPERLAKHPWALRTHLAVVRAARELTEHHSNTDFHEI